MYFVQPSFCIPILQAKFYYIPPLERSEEFLVTECFYNLFLIITIQIQIGKNYWDLETCR